jgi:hypothetical protein
MFWYAFLKSVVRPSHLKDAKAGEDNPVPGLSASKDFSKKDTRNGEG